MRMVRLTRFTGVGVFALGMLLFFVLIPTGIDSPSKVDHISLSPDFWPRIISLIFAAMGLLMLFHPEHKAEEDTTKTDDEAAVATLPLPARMLRFAVVLGALFCFYFAIPALGMVAPAIIFIFALMWFAGERRYATITIISAAVPLLLYGFFVHVANIPIPLGVFEFLRG